MVQSLVSSLTNYGISIWAATNSTQIKHTKNIQNFAVKMALGGAAKGDYVTPFFKGTEVVENKPSV